MFVARVSKAMKAGVDDRAMAKQLREAKPLVEKDVHDFLESRHLYHDLGKTAFWALCNGVDIDPSRFDPEDPQKTAEYIVEQFKAALDSLARVKEDARILRQREAELIYAVGAIDGLRAQLKGLESLYETVNRMMCQSCRQRVMMTLALQYFSKATGIQLEEVKRA
jgi:hypothetical protein